MALPRRFLLWVWEVAAIAVACAATRNNRFESKLQAAALSLIQERGIHLLSFALRYNPAELRFNPCAQWIYMLYLD